MVDDIDSCQRERMAPVTKITYDPCPCSQGVGYGRHTKAAGDKPVRGIGGSDWFRPCSRHLKLYVENANAFEIRNVPKTASLRVAE